MEQVLFLAYAITGMDYEYENEALLPPTPDLDAAKAACWDFLFANDIMGNDDEYALARVDKVVVGQRDSTEVVWHSREEQKQVDLEIAAAEQALAHKERNLDNEAWLYWDMEQALMGQRVMH